MSRRQPQGLCGLISACKRCQKWCSCNGYSRGTNGLHIVACVCSGGAHQLGIAHATRFVVAVKTLCGLSVWARSRGSPSGPKSADRICDSSPSSFRNAVFFQLVGLTGLHQRPRGTKCALCHTGSRLASAAWRRVGHPGFPSEGAAHAARETGRFRPGLGGAFPALHGHWQARPRAMTPGRASGAVSESGPGLAPQTALVRPALSRPDPEL